MRKKKKIEINRGPATLRHSVDSTYAHVYLSISIYTHTNAQFLQIVLSFYTLNNTSSW